MLKTIVLTNSMMNMANFIYDIKKNLCCSDQFLMDVMGLKEPQYRKSLVTGNFKFKEILKVADLYKINLTNLENNSIDYSIIRRSLVTPSLCIHDKYLLGGGSYIESVRVIYNYISSVFSEDVANSLLSRYELHPNVLLNDTMMVNSELINDLLDFIFLELNLEQKDLLLMAMSTYSTKRRQQVLESGMGKTSDYNVAKAIVENIQNFEVNFDYTIEKLDSTLFRVNSISRESANDRAGKAEIASQYTVEYKVAIIKVFYSLTGKNPPQMIEVENIVRNGRQNVNFVFKETQLGSNFLN